MAYETLRHFADSWGLVFLALVFIGVVAWVLQPGAKGCYRDQAGIPFRYDEDKEQ